MKVCFRLLTAVPVLVFGDSTITADGNPYETRPSTCEGPACKCMAQAMNPLTLLHERLHPNRYQDEQLLKIDTIKAFGQTVHFNHFLFKRLFKLFMWKHKCFCFVKIDPDLPLQAAQRVERRSVTLPNRPAQPEHAFGKCGLLELRQRRQFLVILLTFLLKVSIMMLTKRLYNYVLFFLSRFPDYHWSITVCIKDGGRHLGWKFVNKNNPTQYLQNHILSNTIFKVDS